MSDGPGIAIAVPTFHRPVELARLLDALAPQIDAGTRVVVIDNDPGGSARAVVERAGFVHVVEPARGLAAVRNRAVDEAGDSGALLFIDDDEVPAPDWVRTLVGRWRSSGAAAVSGRVVTRFPDGWTDPWIEGGGFFRRTAFADGAAQPAAATNNLLLDLTFLNEHGLRFDERFGLSGGEDILLTRQIVQAGGRVESCPDALVWDDVDPSRLDRRWVLRRAYRVGVTTARVDARLGAGVRGRVRAVTGGTARVAVGGARFLLGQLLGRPAHSARGARAAWRGAGLVVGGLGGDYKEYARR